MCVCIYIYIKAKPFCIIVLGFLQLSALSSLLSLGCASDRVEGLWNNVVKPELQWEMLEYEWGNPSPIMLSGDEPPQDSDQTRQIFDHYHQTFTDGLVAPATAFFHHQSQPQPAHIHSLYDPRAYHTYQAPPPAMLSLEPVAGTSAGGGTGFMVVPKSEEMVPAADFTARIGLNLGGRTYFSSEDDFVNRLYQRRSRPAEPGLTNSPRCQAEGCNADLTHAKHYHRRHKVCEFHSKASTVFAAGLTQRFCQQCSRFSQITKTPLFTTKLPAI